MAKYQDFRKFKRMDCYEEKLFEPKKLYIALLQCKCKTISRRRV
jgi:hypothetical protein